MPRYIIRNPTIYETPISADLYQSTAYHKQRWPLIRAPSYSIMSPGIWIVDGNDERADDGGKSVLSPMVQVERDPCTEWG